MNVYLAIVIIVSAGFFTGSIVLGTVHEKTTVSANFGDTIIGEINSWIGGDMVCLATIEIHISVGKLRYFIFEEGLWSTYAETEDGFGSGTGYLDASNTNNNNVTLVFEKVGSYLIWLDSSQITVTIDIIILSEIIAPGLALSGVVSISLIVLWLIKREQKNA